MYHKARGRQAGVPWTRKLPVKGLQLFDQLQRTSTRELVSSRAGCDDSLGRQALSVAPLRRERSTTADLTTLRSLTNQNQSSGESWRWNSSERVGGRAFGPTSRIRHASPLGSAPMHHRHLPHMRLLPGAIYSGKSMANLAPLHRYHGGYSRQSVGGEYLRACTWHLGMTPMQMKLRACSASGGFAPRHFSRVIWKYCTMHESVATMPFTVRPAGVVGDKM